MDTYVAETGRVMPRVHAVCRCKHTPENQLRRRDRDSPAPKVLLEATHPPQGSF